jgi:hypothetical protein
MVQRDVSGADANRTYDTLLAGQKQGSSVATKTEGLHIYFVMGFIVLPAAFGGN